jgi:hypothetical protein
MYKTVGEIVLDVKLKPSHVSHAFIVCQDEDESGEPRRAITNARSLVEAVLPSIEKQFVKSSPDCCGNHDLTHGLSRSFNLPFQDTGRTNSQVRFAEVFCIALEIKPD